MNWLQVIATSASAAAAVSGLVWRTVVLPLRRIAVRQEEFRSDWDGTSPRPGVPGRPGVMVRLAGIEARVEQVEHELRPNSGGSLRDAVDRVEQAVQPDQRPDVGP